jgi:hypothetical protein
MTRKEVQQRIQESGKTIFLPYGTTGPHLPAEIAFDMISSLHYHWPAAGQ